MSSHVTVKGLEIRLICISDGSNGLPRSNFYGFNDRTCANSTVLDHGTLLDSGSISRYSMPLKDLCSLLART